MIIEGKKASIILILKILEEYSDANHYLTQQEICNLVYSKYELELERKSVGAAIGILGDLGYDINRGNKGGFALFERKFDESEVRFLIDAIFSSKSISGTQARSLSKKISDDLSKYDRKSFEYLVKSTDYNRTNNKNVFFNIDIIHEAIKKNKWVGFKYQSYDSDGKETLRFNGYVYHVSPCYLVNNYGRYYLLGFYNKYQSVVTWKVDNMVDIYVMEERDRIDPKTLNEFKNYPSISNYLNDHIYLFGGEIIKAEVEINNASSISYIVEWFGSNANIYKKNDKLYASIKSNEAAFYYWIMQYNEHFKLLSPQKMIDKVKESALKMVEMYK